MDGNVGQGGIVGQGGNVDQGDIVDQGGSGKKCRNMVYRGKAWCWNIMVNGISYSVICEIFVLYFFIIWYWKEAQYIRKGLITLVLIHNEQWITMQI